MSLAKYLNRSLTKAAANRICTLKPLEAEHAPIHLSSGEQFLGRSKETGIRDARCSKRQLHLQVNMSGASIKLKVLGVNPCGVNGVMAMQNTECELQHGDVLEVVYGRHTYEVAFNPPPTQQTEDAEPIRNNSVDNITESDKWASVDNGKLVIYTSAGVLASEKIAGYDMDGTIIKTKSGNVFPKNTDDWQIIFPEVSEKLHRLHKDGFKLCFFTNQAGIAKGKIKLDDFKVKIKQIVKKLDVPIQVFIAVGAGYYRKPLPGMWKHLVNEMNDSVEIKLERSFFVGDAAGRPEAGKGLSKRRKDHSLADRLFAMNIGVSFYTPEVHFLNQRVEEWNKPDFDPTSVHKEISQFENNDVKFELDKCEMIIMVGLPGSGKSHFCQEILSAKRYKILNADTLGSVQTCLVASEQALRSGISCVIDNTNVDVASRKKFLNLANELKIPVRCFVMNLTPGQVKHNIAYRELSNSSHSKINDMVFNMMKKKYQAPSLEEGFVSIEKVNFKPQFSDQKEFDFYTMFLLEK